MIVYDLKWKLSHNNRQQADDIIHTGTSLQLFEIDGLLLILRLVISYETTNKSSFYKSPTPSPRTPGKVSVYYFKDRTPFKAQSCFST